MNLCKEKNEDRLWIDEIAAMRALSRPDFPQMGTSGIVLASEGNDRDSQIMNLRDGGPSPSHGHHNGSMDMFLTDSAMIHGSLDANQGMLSMSHFHLQNAVFYSVKALILYSLVNWATVVPEDIDFRLL